MRIFKEYLAVFEIDLTKDMTNYEKMAQLLIEHGMNKKIARPWVTKKFKEDRENFVCDESTIEWTMSKGFFPGRVELFGLTEENYQKFLPDYCDLMMHPYNNHFVIWINDKLSLKYTLGKEFAEIMPKYYLYIENNGDYTYLMDAPQTVRKDKDFILNLLKQERTLIIKPNSSSSGGSGVMKVEWKEEGIKINNADTITIEQFNEMTRKLYNNIVTEYNFQHHELKKIWSESECTLRVVMARLPRKEYWEEPRWKCIASFARFGTSISGGASNLSSGGIGVGFDFNTGMLKELGVRYKQFCPNESIMHSKHPDTGIVWKGIALPNWNYVRDNIFKLCKHYDSLDHLGFDIIITEKGFVLCEINSKPATNYAQIICEPFLLDEENRAYFESKGLKRIDVSKFYQIYRDCQE